MTGDDGFIMIDFGFRGRGSASMTDVRPWADRTGLFRDSVSGRAPMPPAATTLGFEFL